MTMQVADARAVLAQVLAAELPALEEAIDARDFELALALATVVRSARLQVRSLLGGGDHVGALRADWARIEPRLDAALICAPRAGGDPETAKRQWTQRLARGTGSPGIPRAERKPRTTAPMAAVSRAIDEEVYFAPSASERFTADSEEAPTLPRLPRPSPPRQR